MLKMSKYPWIYPKKRVLNMLELWMCLIQYTESCRFLRKPKKVLLYDSQKYHLKEDFHSHLQGLDLPKSNGNLYLVQR